MADTAEKKNTVKKPRKLYVSEIVWYSILGAIWLLGFVFAILGVCAYNVGKLSNNQLYQLEKSFATFFGQEGKVFDFRLWGTLVMVVAMIGFLIAIYAYSNKAQAEIDAARRKKERMAILDEFDATHAASTTAAAQAAAPAEPAKKEVAPAAKEEAPQATSEPAPSEEKKPE